MGEGNRRKARRQGLLLQIRRKATKSMAARMDVQRGKRKLATLVREVAGPDESQSAKVASARLGDASNAPVHQQSPGDGSSGSRYQALSVDTLLKVQRSPGNSDAR